MWLKNEDIPGLAMTRSFGDGVAHSVGCKAIPEMNEYQFKFWIKSISVLFYLSR